MDVQTRRTELGRIRKKKQRNLMRRKARQLKRRPTTTWKPSKIVPIPHSPSSSTTSLATQDSPNPFLNTHTTLSGSLQKERNQSMYVAPQVAAQVATQVVAQVPNAPSALTTNVTHQYQPDSIAQEYDILHDFTTVLMEEYDVVDRFADDIPSPSAIMCC